MADTTRRLASTDLAPESQRDPLPERRPTCPDILSSPRHRPEASTAGMHVDFAATKPQRLALRDGEVQAFRHLARSIVTRTLTLESEYHRLRRPEMDERDWKLLKRENQLRVYKRKPVDKSAPPAKQPVVLCVGSVVGSLEDVLFGFQAKTRAEIQANTAFLGKKGPLDWFVMANIDNGSELDPLRHMSVKWLLQESFGDARFVNPRDVCNLETTGFGMDARGERYGYFLTKSVDHPDCPPLPESSNVVRMNMMMCYIFRQEPGAHAVDVYGRGMLDLGGDLPVFMGYNGATSMMLCVEEAIQSAEAKRLTWLALRNMREAPQSQGSGIEKSVFELALEAQAEHSQVEGSYAEYSYAYSDQSYAEQSYAEKSQVSLFSPSATSPSRVSRDPTEATSATHLPSPTKTKALSKRNFNVSSKSKDSERSRRQKAKPCHVCGKKKPVMAKLMGSRHRRCGICEEPVCGKCYVKRQLLALPEPVSVSCCKVCLVEAKQIDIDPREPCPMLP